MHQETKEGTRPRRNARCGPAHRLRRWIGSGGLLLALALAGCQPEQTTSPDETTGPADAEVAPELVTEEGAAAGPDLALASTTTVTPWRDENFSRYTSDAHWRSNPFGWQVSAPTWYNQGAIHIDRSVTYDGHQTLRYDWPAPPSGYTASYWCNKQIAREADYRLPDVREVWIEVVHKFATTFNTNHTSSGGYCGTAQYKFLLPRLKGVSHRIGGMGNGTRGYQWWNAHPSSVNQTVYGTNCSGIGWDCRMGYGTGQSIYQANVPGPLWDGQWHVYRIHVKLTAYKGEKSGIVENWIDGKLVKRLTGQDFIRWNGDWSNRFDALALGSNSNSGTSRATSNWWGRLRIWTTNPGW